MRPATSSQIDDGSGVGAGIKAALRLLRETALPEAAPINVHTLRSTQASPDATAADAGVPLWEPTKLSALSAAGARDASASSVRSVKIRRE